MKRLLAGLALALLATGCAVGDSVELRIDEKARPAEAGIEFLVLTTPLDKDLDQRLQEISALGDEKQHAAIGQLFAEQGPFQPNDTERFSYRFRLMSRVERERVVLHVSPGEPGPRALWIFASYAQGPQRDVKHWLRWKDDHRHAHVVRVSKTGIAWERQEAGS